MGFQKKTALNYKQNITFCPNLYYTQKMDKKNLLAELQDSRLRLLKIREYIHTLPANTKADQDTKQDMLQQIENGIKMIDEMLEKASVKDP